MRKIGIIVLILLLVSASIALADPRTIDLDTMDLSELKNLAEEVQQKIDEHSDENTAEEVISITADKLSEAYEENEIAADKRYKGKILKVTGVVESIDQGWFGGITVKLSVGGDWDFNTIDCSFDSEHEDAIAELKTGERVEIIGECDGNGFMSVGLDDCHF
jgi:hypothetical protein